MKSRKRSKQANNILRAKRLVKGLIVQWESTEPFAGASEVTAASATHTNPLMRLTAAKVFQDFGDYITARQSFLWRVRITVAFRYPNGTDQLEDRELVAHAVLNRVNEHCFEAIRDAMRHGDMSHYVTTRFRVECLGDRAPQESDFLLAEA